MIIPKKLVKCLCFLMLSCLLLTSLTACIMGTQKVKAASLMDDIKANDVTGKAADSAFTGSTADFSIELFKKAADSKDNSLVSPISVLLALSMTANGANGETLSQMEKVLGGSISIDKLNEYLYSYVQSLPSSKKSKLSIANSIWFRNEQNHLKVEQDFLQKNADYYNAAAYSSSFDDQTLKDINSWVKNNTGGMIDSILSRISPSAVMYLINAVTFDAEWERIYETTDIRNDYFITLDGKKQDAKFMSSDEGLYIDDGKATGFIKNYSGGSYSFAAILPNTDVDINTYLADMTGDSFMNTIKNAKKEAVRASIPKFSYDYSIELNETLKSMGMPLAFDEDNADFKRLGTSSLGNIYIGEVLHKTFISVDEKGTKAGAVTKVEMREKCAAMEGHVVFLNRPFIYAIIDNSTGLPVFIGKLMSIE